MLNFTAHNNIEGYKLLPTHLWSKECFACGENNPHGLHMKFYTDEKYIFSKINLEKEKRGWDIIAHGGIQSTILDEVMAWAAIYFTNNIVLTKNMSIDFKHPVIVNTDITAVSWITADQTRKEIILKSHLYNHKNILCTEATGVYAIFSVKVAKKLHLMTEKSLDNFQIFMDACCNI